MLLRPMPPIKRLSRAFHHRGELVIKLLAGSAFVHEAQIDRGKMIDGQSAQVVLDPLGELRRRIETQHPARAVPSRAYLADQRQSPRDMDTAPP